MQDIDFIFKWFKKRIKLTFGEASVLNMWSVKSWLLSPNMRLVVSSTSPFEQKQMGKRKSTFFNESFDTFRKTRIMLKKRYLSNNDWSIGDFLLVIAGICWKNFLESKM